MVNLLRGGPLIGGKTPKPSDQMKKSDKDVIPLRSCGANGASKLPASKLKGVTSLPDISTTPNTKKGLAKTGSVFNRITTPNNTAPSSTVKQTTGKQKNTRIREAAKLRRFNIFSPSTQRNELDEPKYPLEEKKVKSTNQEGKHTQEVPKNGRKGTSSAVGAGPANSRRSTVVAPTEDSPVSRQERTRERPTTLRRTFSIRMPPPQEQIQMHDDKMPKTPQRRYTVVEADKLKTPKENDPRTPDNGESRPITSPATKTPLGPTRTPSGPGNNRSQGSSAGTSKKDAQYRDWYALLDKIKGFKQKSPSTMFTRSDESERISKRAQDDKMPKTTRRRYTVVETDKLKIPKENDPTTPTGDDNRRFSTQGTRAPLGVGRTLNSPESDRSQGSSSSSTVSKKDAQYKDWYALLDKIKGFKHKSPPGKLTRTDQSERTIERIFETPKGRSNSNRPSCYVTPKNETPQQHRVQRKSMSGGAGEAGVRMRVPPRLSRTPSARRSSREDEFKEWESLLARIKATSIQEDRQSSKR